MESACDPYPLETRLFAEIMKFVSSLLDVTHRFAGIFADPISDDLKAKRFNSRSMLSEVLDRRSIVSSSS